MVGLGMLFIVLTWFAMFLLWRRTLFKRRWLLWVFVFAVLGPYAANQLGWMTAEVGRQPWVVYPTVQNGVEMMGLRTADGLSESVHANQVLWSIIMFGIIYFLLFCIWVWVMNEKIKHGPESPGEREAFHVETGFLQAGARVMRGEQHMIDPDQRHDPGEEGASR
jgi:cytochrome d ubiquinol oxidase subunit I